MKRPSILTRKTLLSTIIVILSVLISLFFYGKSSSHTITIHAPIEDVWAYASDSSKAEEWSVYFTHISSLPGVEDGKVGALRRCFRRADETGIRWDEEVVQIKPLAYREIRTFNIKGFPDASFENVEFKVHQHYRKIDENTTNLTFASELRKPFSPIIIIKLLFTVSEGKRIFRLNLENIKAAIEQKESYKRIHAYEEENRFDPNP
ncbi:MAG: SRPBCC family protein [Myxococcota bacterium]|nr:SRPBCC family protein [Myxococcota bacterium]